MYRESPPGHVSPDSPDTVLLAAQAFERRASRLRTVVIVGCVLLGLAIGTMGYFVLRDLQGALIGMHSPWITGFVSMGMAFPASLRAAQALSRAAVAWRSAAWIAEIAATHGIRTESLEEYTKVLNG